MKAAWFIPLARKNAPRLALAPLLLLAGCATPTQVAEQNEALGERLARIEATLYRTARNTDTALALAQQLETQLQARRHAPNPLQEDVETLQDTQSVQAETLLETGQRLARTQATADDALEKANLALRVDRDSRPRIDRLAGELDFLRDRLNSLVQQLGGQSRRLGQTEATLGQTTALAQEALHQASTRSQRIEGEVMHSVILPHDHLMYPLNSSELNARDFILLDTLVSLIRTLDHDYHLEIQGHSEDSGNHEYNDLVAEARANNVRRYLHMQGGVPLQRMSVISLGASAPPPASGEGRRRVELLLLK